jgi:hypothetical protein
MTQESIATAYGPELARYFTELYDDYCRPFEGGLPKELLISTVLPYVSIYFLAMFQNIAAPDTFLDLGTFKGENATEQLLVRVLKGEHSGPMTPTLDIAIMVQLRRKRELDAQAELDRLLPAFSTPIALLYLLEAGAVMSMHGCESLMLRWLDPGGEFVRNYLARHPAAYGAEETFLNYLRLGSSTFFDMIVHFSPREALRLLDTPGLNLRAVNCALEGPVTPHAVFRADDGTWFGHGFLPPQQHNISNISTAYELASSEPIKTDFEGPYRYLYVHYILNRLRTEQQDRDTWWKLAYAILCRDPRQLLEIDSGGHTGLQLLRYVVLVAPLEIAQIILEQQYRLSFPRVETDSDLWLRLEEWLTEDPEAIRQPHVGRFFERTVVQAAAKLVEEALTFRK